MYERILPFIIIFFIPGLVFGQQEGCTDRIAINYDSLAVINDGTCKYDKIIYRPPVIINGLSDSISETSGLIWWRGLYWTHNDSGGSNVIYALDSTTGDIAQSIKILNAKNFDWEDIDHDAKFIYIADLGNNWGNRRDLCIYKIAKSDIPVTGNDSVLAEKITIFYGDQQSFGIKNRANDFDCEALISFGDSLYLFSKNWASHSSKLYGLPKKPGTYVIYPLDDFYTDGLITGASVDLINKTTVLIGYKNYVPFIWILSDHWRNDFFGGNKRRVDFKDLIAAQTEAVTCVSDSVFVISAEKTLVNKAKLFRLDLKEIR